MAVSHLWPTRGTTADSKQQEKFKGEQFQVEREENGAVTTEYKPTKRATLN